MKMIQDLKQESGILLMITNGNYSQGDDVMM